MSTLPGFTPQPLLAAGFLPGRKLWPSLIQPKPRNQPPWRRASARPLRRCTHRYKQPVFANIRKMVPDPDAAEILLQELFTTLWENQQATGPAKGAGGWLFVVSYNKAASCLKKKPCEAAVLEPEAELAVTGLPELG